MDDTRSPIRRTLACAALVALVAAVFARCLGHEFVAIDTAHYITQNPHVLGGLSWNGVAWAFTSFDAANWHPLTWLSHMLDVQLFGTRPAGHQAVNIALHAANAVLLFLLLERTTRAFGRSFFVAALFAVHPLHVESVAWIVERKDVLSTFFGFACLGFYAAFAQNGRRASYVLALVCLALGLMSKAMLVTWPCAMLLFDFWPLRRTQLGWKRLVLEKLPFFALSAAACVLTVRAQAAGAAIQPIAQLSIDVRIVNAIASCGTYLVQAFAIPWRLSFYYPMPPADAVSLAPVVGAILLLVVSFLALVLRRDRPALFTGWFFFVGTLVPVIGLVQVGGQAHADRYTYVPLVGAFIAVVWTLAQLVPARVAAAAGVVVLAGLSFLAWLQVDTWRSSDALAEHALAIDERNAVAHDLLGFHAVSQGQFGRGVAHLRRAIEIEPDDVEARGNLARVLLQMRRLDEAEPELREVLRRRPRDPRALADLGALLVLTGSVEEANQLLRLAIEVNPANLEAHVSLGEGLEKLGQTEEAARMFERALALDPDDLRARVDLARVRLDAGDLEGGRKLLEVAQAAAPSNPQVQQQMARVHVARGEWREAADQLGAALQGRPEWPLAESDLAWVLAVASDPDVKNAGEALKLAKRAWAAGNQQRPNFLDALAAAYAANGGFDNAVKLANDAIAVARATNQTALAARITQRRAAYREGRMDTSIPR
jgi:protein O-mannosyl-transferase